MRKALFLILITAFFSCKHEPVLIPAKPVTDTTLSPGGNNGNVNVNDSVCFSGQILPILISNCAKSGCHNDTAREAGVVLNTYDKVIATVSGNLLIQSITDKGSLGMPQSGTKLDSLQIQLIQTWVRQGMRNGIDCGSSCDTSDVTFAGTINPLIKNYCLGCHSSGTGTRLTGYSNVKSQVNNGKFYCTVIQAGGCQPMPQGGQKLSDCQLREIKIWIDAGAPNN